MPREQQIDVGSTKGKTIAFSPAYIHLCWKLWPKNMFFHHLKTCVFIYHPNAGCLLDQWHGIFKLYYQMLPVSCPGFPEIPAFWGLKWWQRCFRRWHGRTVLCFASIRPCHSTRRWRIWTPLQDGMVGVGHAMGWSPETLGERSDGFDICASCINHFVYKIQICIYIYKIILYKYIIIILYTYKMIYVIF